MTDSPAVHVFPAILTLETERLRLRSFRKATR
jgi:hypothetical protein